MRWFHIVRYGIFRWVRSPRDAVRLGNAVKFSWPALEGEVDPHDLFAMEGLKLFDTSAFNWLRDNRDLLFAEGIYQMARDDVKKAAVEKLKLGIPERVRTQVLEVVCAVFPQVGKWAWDKPHAGGESHVEIVKRRGVATEAGYDNYFALYPSENVVPKSVVDEVMDNLDDADVLERTVRAYLNKVNDQGESMIAGLLDELHFRFVGRDAAKPTPAALDALFRVGEEVTSLDGPHQAFSVPPRAKVWFLIKEMLEHWGPEAAGGHLLRAFDGMPGAAFGADVYVSCGREIGVFESDSRQTQLIERSDFDALGARLLPKIVEGAKHGTLKSAPYYYNIIRAWVHLGDVQDVRAWISQGMTTSAEFTAKLGAGLLTYSVGTRTRTYLMREHPEPEFYNLEQIVSAGRHHLANEGLSDEQRSVISAMVSGAERFASGNDDADGVNTLCLGLPLA